MLADFSATSSEWIRWIYARGLFPKRRRIERPGQEVARADATAMASGINLAPIESTPQFQQTLKLRALIPNEKFELERAQRDIALVMFNIDGVDWANADDATGVAAFEKWEKGLSENEKEAGRVIWSVRAARTFPNAAKLLGGWPKSARNWRRCRQR